MLRRVALSPADLVVAALGSFLTLSTVMFAARYGTEIGLGLTIGACLFVCVVAGFVLVPHIFVAVSIAYFVALPTLKVFGSDLIGGTKDVITFAALAAAGILFVQRRAARASWPVDRPILVLLAFVFGLYVLNIGGNLTGETGYGAAWFHGVRLFAEPVSLLLVGLTLREPRRTFQWAAASVAISSVAVAAYGIAQQSLGVHGLVRLGYSYGVEVRQIGSHLRSFGTLEEPFSYAGMLLIGVAVIALQRRVRAVAVAALAIVGVGLLVSYVRTAAVIAVALVGLLLARRGHLRAAVLTTAVAVVAAVIFFAVATDMQSQRAVRVSPHEYLTLNGRTNVWSDALGHSRSTWLLGRGVGAVGTASQRANESLVGGKSSSRTAKRGTVVDSAYLAVATDIGFVGLAILLALLGRLAVLARAAAVAGAREGWVALGVLVVMLLDALTRESLTGFPTAYIGMLVVGLALASAAARERDVPPSAAA
jgi:O-antigen ligase